MLSKGLKQISKTLGFRLTLWYSSLFILSSTLLFGAAFFLVSSTIREYDYQIVQSKTDEYALMNHTDGLSELMHRVRLEEENNLESGIFVRLSDSQNKTLLSIIPHQWKDLDVEKLEAVPVSFSGEQWRTSVPRDRGDAFPWTGIWVHRYASAIRPRVEDGESASGCVP